MKFTALLMLTILLSASQVSLAKECYQIQNQQIELSESLVRNYFAFDQEVKSLADELIGQESINCSTMAKLEGIARKVGFTDFKQAGDVGQSMADVLMRLESVNAPLKDLTASWRKEIEDLKASYKGQPLKDYDQQYIAELEGQIKMTKEPSINNVALVRKYFSQILDMIQ